MLSLGKKPGSDEEAMLNTRFRDPEVRLFFGRAMLFANRIEFSGLSFSGFYRRLLLLKNVERVEWKVGQIRTSNIIIWMRDGKKMHFWVSGGGLWKYMIDANVRTMARQLSAPGAANQPT